MSWKLFEGDCLEIMPKEIKDHTIDMILCDLPYGMTKCKWDSIIPFDLLWKEYNRVIKENGAIILTGSQPFSASLINSNRKMFRYEWIWEKTRATGFLNAKKMPLKNHENILVFYKKLPTYNPVMTKGKPYVTTYKNESRIYNITKNKEHTTYNTGERYPKSVLKIKSESGKGLHPTQKPVELFEYLIKTYTNKGDLVLDNCAGSGTTSVAAELTGRNSILIENEPEYCDIIRKRLSKIIDDHTSPNALSLDIFIGGSKEKGALSV